MTITVQQMLSKIAFDLQETDYTFSTGLWTVDEVYGYLNHAIRQFINDTGVVEVDNTILTQVGIRNYDRPDDAGDIDRIAFDGKRVRRVSLFDLMSKNPSWRASSGVPQYYHEDGLSVIAFELDKLPTKVGNLRIFSDLIHTDLANLTDVFPLPDCWEQYVRWEALSYALQKDGEVQDLPRADWAHKKYLYGISLCQRMIAGIAD
jgi:hypothetical protein